jgi:hypothetical protein
MRLMYGDQAASPSASIACGVRCVGKELPGREVDALVGRLGRQDDGDQQLERALAYSSSVTGSGLADAQAGEEFMALRLFIIDRQPASSPVGRVGAAGRGPARPGAPRRGHRPSCFQAISSRAG